MRKGTHDALADSRDESIIALVHALEAGADEALMLDPTGAVATCNATNFLIVASGEVWTSTGQYCLNGITRRLVLELCREAGIPSAERAFSLTDGYSADEAFVTGTFGGLTPVFRVDGRTIGAGSLGPVTRHLKVLYGELVHRQGEDRAGGSSGGEDAGGGGARGEDAGSGDASGEGAGKG